MHKHQRILVTNDDGIDAPGLAALVDVAREFAPEIWVVAPEHDESGVGQSLSLHHPLRCHALDEKRFAVSGTPADCVGLAVAHLMKDNPPTLVLSGVNAGSNTGDDVNLSGTLGAAFMGSMLGLPSIAFSLACGGNRKTARWETARAIAPKMLRHFIECGWPPETCLSINIPDLAPDGITGFTWARQSPRTTTRVEFEQRTDLRGKVYFWMNLRGVKTGRDDNFDCSVMDRGDVAVTALSLNRSIDVAIPRVSFAEPKKSAVNE